MTGGERVERMKMKMSEYGALSCWIICGRDSVLVSPSSRRYLKPFMTR